MSDNVDTIIEGFPYSSIEKISGEPSYHNIKEVERKLIKNASSFPSELGGGQHGYLGLVLSPEKYQLVTGNTFTPHPNPGSIPTFPEHPTQPQIAQISTTHKEQLRLWRQQHELIKAIKKQLTNAFDDKLLKEIEDTYTGYNNVSIQEILQYLYDRFGEVTPSELEEAEKELSQPFEPFEPFGVFISKIEDAIDIAEAANCPFTTQQIINKALTSIIKAQALPDAAIREWRSKSTADKTWANFKRHFSKEVKDYQRDQGLTAKSTYNVANSTNQALLQAQADFRSMTEQFIDEFRKTNHQVNHTPEPLVEQAHATTTTDLLSIIKELRQEVAALKQDKENINPNYKRKPNQYYKKKPFQYCWTHGATKSHCSKNCWGPIEGHKKEATFANRMGGSCFKLLDKEVKKQLSNS